MGLRILLAALTDPALGVDVNHKSHSRLSVATVSVKTLFYGLAPLLISLPPIDIDIDDNESEQHKHHKPIFHENNEFYINSRTIPQPSIDKTLFDTLAIAPTIYFCNRITLGERSFEECPRFFMPTHLVAPENQSPKHLLPDDEKKFKSPKDILDRCPLLREIYIGEQRRLIVYGNDTVDDKVLNGKRRLSWEDDENLLLDGFMQEYSKRNMIPQLEVLQINRIRKLTFKKHLFGEYKLLQNGSHLRVLNLACCRQLFSSSSRRETHHRRRIGNNNRRMTGASASSPFFIFNELPKTLQELNLSGTGMRDDDVVVPDADGVENRVMNKFMLPRLHHLDISYNKRLSSKSYHFICSRVAAFSLRTFIAKACGAYANRATSHTLSGDDEDDDDFWNDIEDAQDQDDGLDEQLGKDVTAEFYDKSMDETDDSDNKTLCFTLTDLPPSITEVDFSEGTISRFLFAPSWLPKEEQENLFETNLSNLRKIEVSNSDNIIRFGFQVYLFGLLPRLESFNCCHSYSERVRDTHFLCEYVKTYTKRYNSSLSSSPLTSLVMSSPLVPDEIALPLSTRPGFFKDVKELKLFQFSVPNDSIATSQSMRLVAAAFPNITSLYLDNQFSKEAKDEVLAAFVKSEACRKNLKCLTLQNLPGITEDSVVKHVFEAYESLTKLKICVSTDRGQHFTSDAFLLGLAKSRFVRDGTLQTLAFTCNSASTATVTGWSTLLKSLHSVEALILENFVLPREKDRSSSSSPLRREDLFSNLHQDMPRLSHFEFIGRAWDRSESAHLLLPLLRDLDKCKHLKALKIGTVFENVAKEVFKVLNSKEMMQHLRVMDCSDESLAVVNSRKILHNIRDGKHRQEELYENGKLDYFDRFYFDDGDDDDDDRSRNSEEASSDEDDENDQEDD